jgi:hypothetical protein
VQAYDDAGEEMTGSMHTEFSADGFTSGCNPKSRPRFVVQAKPDDEDADEAPPPKARSTTPSPSPEPAPTPGPEPEPAEDDGAIVPPPDKPGYAQ